MKQTFSFSLSFSRHILAMSLISEECRDAKRDSSESTDGASCLKSPDASVVSPGSEGGDDGDEKEEEICEHSDKGEFEC